GKNRIANRSIAAYYKHIARITRDPIWSYERWRSIWMLNTGQLDALIPEATCRFAGAMLISSAKVSAPIPDGTPWNASTTIFHGQGVCVQFDKPTPARRLTIAADGNDTLRLYVVAGEEIVARVRRRGVAKAGVQTSSHDLENMDGAMIDRVCVFPEVGDGAYSLGQLVLE
ncbi:MAG: hypothetical protein VX475_02380, partial [Myxococcota bacterium]|nr:hypothetical protein [Myxococcota bacterium]